MNDYSIYPLRVEQLLSASLQEWRCGEGTAPRLCENWQLVYLLNGTIEEREDGKSRTMRRGQLCLHEAGKTVSMRALGEIPPEVMRIDFWCGGAELRLLSGSRLQTGMSEQIYLTRLGKMLRDVFAEPDPPDAPAPLRLDPPFAAMQLLSNLLEMLLISLVRRQQAGRKTSARTRREQGHTALLETVQDYFARHLTEEVTVEQVCAAVGCSRAALQEVFRTRLKTGAMEYFAKMKLDRARELLAEGSTPGETAAQLGYSSGAYFSHCFKKAVGLTPHAYQKQAYAASMPMVEKDKPHTEKSIG